MLDKEFDSFIMILISFANLKKNVRSVETIIIPCVKIVPARKDCALQVTLRALYLAK